MQTKAVRQFASKRRGAVTVEMALVTPVLFLLLFATVEFSRVNMVRNTVKNSCFEGARRASLPGATAADVRAVTEKMLTDVGVKKASVEVLPSVITNSTKSVIVHVSAPLNANAWISPRFFKNAVIERACRLNREYVNPEDADKPDPLDNVELTLIPNEVSELDELMASGGVTAADLVAATQSTATSTSSAVGTTVAGLTGSTSGTSGTAGSVSGTSGSTSTGLTGTVGGALGGTSGSTASGSGGGTTAGTSSTASTGSAGSTGGTIASTGTTGGGSSGTASTGGATGTAGGGSGAAVAGSGSAPTSTGSTGTTTGSGTVSGTTGTATSSTGGTAATSSGTTSASGSSAGGSTAKASTPSLFDLLQKARQERQARDRRGR